MPQKSSSIPSDAIHCVTGLVYQVLKPGTGNDQPGPNDIVQVVLKQAQADTEPLLDTSDESSAPQTISVGKVIPGLAEAFQLMAVGQKMRVWIPAHLADGKSQEVKERTLIFDIEMVSFTRLKEPPSLPRELTSPQKEE